MALGMMSTLQWPTKRALEKQYRDMVMIPANTLPAQRPLQHFYKKVENTSARRIVRPDEQTKGEGNVGSDMSWSHALRSSCRATCYQSHKDWDFQSYL